MTGKPSRNFKREEEGQGGREGKKKKEKLDLPGRKPAGAEGGGFMEPPQVVLEWGDPGGRNGGSQMGGRG